jgi:hypothetical protein
MAAIVQAIGWLVGKVFADNLLRYIATKALIFALVVVVLPIILNNLVYDLIEIIQLVVTDQLSGTTLESSSLAVTGVAAWLFTTCKIGEAFSVVVSAIVVRASLNLIPFVRI